MTPGPPPAARSPGERATSRPRLRREIGLLGFFSLAFGSIVGIGWVTALGGWLDQAGPLGTMIAFLLGGALMMTIGLCYAEVTPMLPVAGGEVAYAYKAFGTGKAFVVGWYLAFGYLSVSAFEAISIGKVSSYLFPAIDAWPLYEIGDDTVYGGHALLALASTAFITWINHRGVRQATRLQTFLTLGFIAVTLVFVSAGLWNGRAANLEPLFARTGAGDIAAGTLAVLVTVPFWYVGFDTIPQGAEEADAAVPPRRLGITILAAIFGATVFYVVLVLSAASAAPWREITGERLPTAAAFEAAFESKALANLVLVAALIGLFTSWNGFFLAGSRVLFALGRGRIIPGSFGASHPRHGTPATAVLFSGAVTFLAALLGRGAMIAFIDVGSFCIAAAFLGVTLSTLRLRRDFPGLHRPYRMPGGPAVAFIALGGSVAILGFLLVPWSPAALKWPLEWAILAAFSLLGALFWWLGAGLRRRTTEDERAYLILEE